MKIHRKLMKIQDPIEILRFNFPLIRSYRIKEAQGVSPQGGFWGAGRIHWIAPGVV